MGSDLATTVEALLGTERPSATCRSARIILETSGLSKPGPILRQLGALAQHRMRAAVVATYDPTAASEIADFEEAAAQWAGAHRIVLTKGDMVSPERFAAASAEASCQSAGGDRGRGGQRPRRRPRLRAAAAFGAAAPASRWNSAKRGRTRGCRRSSASGRARRL